MEILENKFLMKYNKIFIMGEAGYIGSHLTLKFCEKNENVVAFNDLSVGIKKNL